MIHSVFNFLFRCQHRNLSMPMSPTGTRAVNSPPTFVVCLDCGKRFEYDWKQMRIVQAGRPLDEKSGPARKVV